tara:strand:- start:168 stop:341 length:174 start_codon:yes stop_codon:yes gene_type:complete
MTIKEKIEALTNEFNELAPKVQQAQARLTEIQGAVKELNTLLAEESTDEKSTEVVDD